jgi:hypothetical protein
MQFNIQYSTFKISLSLLLFALCSLLFAPLTQAVSPTPTPTSKISPTPTAKPSLVDEISNLKDRIASRVAQLNLVDKRGIIGVVEDTTSTQITLNDFANNTRYVDVDEITKFSSPSASASFGISDLTKGTLVSVLGLYNKESRRINARFVTVDSFPTTITGQVISINTTDGTFLVASENNKQTTVDVQPVTKTSSYTKDGGTEKSGFSKMTVGQRVYVSGYQDKKDKLKLISTRIILFPDLPKNPKIVIPTAQLEIKDTPTVSTGSGKKLTPIK